MPLTRLIVVTIADCARRLRSAEQRRVRRCRRHGQPVCSQLAPRPGGDRGVWTIGGEFVDLGRVLLDERARRARRRCRSGRSSRGTCRRGGSPGRCTSSRSVTTPGRESPGGQVEGDRRRPLVDTLAGVRGDLRERSRQLRGHDRVDPHVERHHRAVGRRELEDQRAGAVPAVRRSCQDRLHRIAVEQQAARPFGSAGGRRLRGIARLIQCGVRDVDERRRGGAGLCASIAPTAPTIAAARRPNPTAIRTPRPPHRPPLPVGFMSCPPLPLPPLART